MSNGRFKRIAARVQFGYVEPVQTALRKRARMRLLRIEELRGLPAAAIDLEAGRAGCGRDCTILIEGHRRYLAKYLFRADAPSRAAVMRGVPLLLDLDRYPDFAAYAARLKRQSKGALMRQIGRARRLGFDCAPFDRKDYGEDRYRIDTSMLFRSAGLVLPAALRLRPAPRTGTAQLACPRHWYADWGVFHGAGAERRLVGYMFLKRIGSTVRVTAFMGHGAHLSQGVMKLLFVEAMHWLLARGDPRVEGVRYLHYGAVEHGGTGLLTWKRRFQFAPFVFDWAPAAGAEGGLGDAARAAAALSAA